MGWGKGRRLKGGEEKNETGPPPATGQRAGKLSQMDWRRWVQRWGQAPPFNARSRNKKAAPNLTDF